MSVKQFSLPKSRLLRELQLALLGATLMLANLAYADEVLSAPADSSNPSEDLAEAYAWLGADKDKRFSLQVLTINGRAQCESQLTAGTGQYCFESSSVRDRWFVLSGRYVSLDAAESAAQSAGLRDYMVSYIPRVQRTRCEMDWLPIEYRGHCAQSETENLLAAEVSAAEIELAPVTEPSLSTPESKSAKSESAVESKPALPDALSVSVDCEAQEQPETRPRRRPGYPVLEYNPTQCNPDRLPLPQAHLLPEMVAVPDRWRIVESLGYPENLWDPYNNNNPLKGDKPLFGKPGKDWFFNVSAISDTVYEPRRFPLPVGNASTASAGQLDLLAQGDQYLINENLLVETVLYRGDTVFRPPDHEFRLITVFNINHTVTDEIGVLKADPAEGDTRTEGYVGIQGAFWDYHIRNVSDRYDFDSFRIGIQPFSSDFRGFLFQDNQLGIRFFGTRNNNIFQYNLAWFRRLEKESNSGLNDITDQLRRDDVFIGNLYWQDFPRKGFFSQATVIHNRNKEINDFFFDDNQFIARPSSLGFERGRDYAITYLGLNGDGHFGRNNLTYSAYYAIGEQSNGVFINEETQVNAYFFAAEFSRDYDWIRPKISFLHSSGDDDPFDNQEKGFDAIFENPQFAGADTSFFIRQNVPLIGGGRVALNGRNSIIPSLRSSKEHGQSNFTNPGLTLLGVGADIELTPQARLSFNLNQLWFDDTSSLELARNQTAIGKRIGLDASVALIWRPLATQNIVFRLSGAVLDPGPAFVDLYGDTRPFSVLANLILAY
ncbi:MAG: hypothetical protein AAF197_01650 [Pseudomonadota bacterium]